MTDLNHTGMLTLPPGVRAAPEPREDRSAVARIDAVHTEVLAELATERKDLLRRLAKNGRDWARARDSRDALLGASTEEEM